MLTDLVPYEEMNGWYVYFPGSGKWQIEDGFWVPKGGQPPTDLGEKTPCSEEHLNKFWDKEVFYFLSWDIVLPTICASCDRLKVKGEDYLCQECRDG